ncbi:MAG: class I SAM-dependent methyltransferase [Pseudomonadota bacterium]
MPDDLTDFGFTRVPVKEKASRVAAVFHSVADRYDMMNDIMSFGTHRLMKRFAIELTAVRAGDAVLDLAGGTGDLAALLSPIVGVEGRVILCDINPSMVQVGRDRLINRGLVSNIDYLIGDAEQLPFADQVFDAVTMAFGLRNVTDKARALASIHRTLKPGGKLVVLEFSKPGNTLIKGAYETFQSTWPKIGKLVVGDDSSYRYLVESIAMHPDQEALRDMVLAAGFESCRYHNLFDGVAAIHVGTAGAAVAAGH